MPRFTIRLDDTTAAYFDRFAERFGGRSQALRALIEEALIASRTAGSAEPEAIDKQRLEIRLGAEDMALLVDAARSRHCKPTRWASRLIRAQLRGEPIELPLDLTAALDGFFAKRIKAREPITRGELDEAGQMRLQD